MNFNFFFYQVIELLGQEKIHMSPKQISEALDLVNKEELLEMEGKIEKALSKSAASAAGANSPPSAANLVLPC